MTGKKKLYVQYKKNALKKGAVITLKNEDKTGKVIDWGFVVNMKKGFGEEGRELLIPNRELADSVRVFTNKGTIEIWPVDAVELN